MAGNDYCQMVYAHSLVETAVYARLWEAFEDWLVSDNSDDISDISKFASDLSSFWEMVNMRNSVLDENETRNAVMVSLDKVMKVFDRFLQQCTSPTSKLWLMYLEMVDILRRYIYAERSGNWTLITLGNSRRDASMLCLGWAYEVYCLCSTVHNSHEESPCKCRTRVSSVELYCTKKGREV